MRKYFDQKFKTKFSKQIMSKEDGFQWVIKEMEEEFEYPEEDIKTFDEFFSVLTHYNIHISYFIRIYELDKEKLEINNEFVNILSDIARFALREKSIHDILKGNNYKNFTIMYLLGLVAGFVQKIRVSGAYDFGMFVYYNWFELHEIRNMSQKNKKYIERLLRDLTISEKNKIIEIYLKNYNEIKKEYDEKNLKSLKKYNNLFTGCGYRRNQFCTWQEDYILKMAKLRFSISEIIPQFSSRTWKVPNYDLWDEKILKNMKKFFENNNNALTILEIVDYRLHNQGINCHTQKVVFDQVLEKIKNQNRQYDFDNIWFYILIKQMKEKNNYIKNNISQIYVELKKKRNIQIILFLKEKGFQMDKELQTKIDNYYIKQIKRIGQIEELYTFNNLLQDEYIKKNINIEMIENIMKVFNKLIGKNENDMQVSSCFYYTINFLVVAKLKVNNEIINNYIFNILKLWKEEYYEKMKSLLKEYKYEFSIKNEEIERYNKLFIQNPLIYFRSNFSWSEQKILREMSVTSNFAFSSMLRENTIYIDDFIPYIKKIDLTQKDSLDNIFCQYLENMQIKYEEQLLNSNMDPIVYLGDLYKNYSFALSTFVSAISEENYKKMYKDIEEGFLKYNLLPYPKEIKVAHITQLIPLVELLIRELGVKNNIVPFKEKINQIHVMKDSSTILLAIIKKKFRENKSFENIEIYMYLYNFLYNVNSLNIRNELIHAREYLDTVGNMKFAFRVLIIGIFWGAIELYKD